VIYYRLPTLACSVLLVNPMPPMELASLVDVPLSARQTHQPSRPHPHRTPHTPASPAQAHAANSGSSSSVDPARLVQNTTSTTSCSLPPALGRSAKKHNPLHTCTSPVHNHKENAREKSRRTCLPEDLLAWLADEALSSHEAREESNILLQ
jgi:hypothetical protein